MGATVIVTDSTFDAEVLNSEKPVVVDFWAEWCGPCKLVAPILEEIAGANPQIKIVKLNVDENPNTAVKFQIRGIPAVMLFKGGQIVDAVVGLQPKDAFKQAIDKHL